MSVEKKLIYNIVFCFFIITLGILPAYSNSYYQAKYPKITKIERNIFKNTHENEDIYIRLNRLEKKLFGTTFPKSSLAERADKLNQYYEKNIDKKNK